MTLPNIEHQTLVSQGFERKELVETFVLLSEEFVRIFKKSTQSVPTPQVLTEVQDEFEATVQTSKETVATQSKGTPPFQRDKQISDFKKNMDKSPEKKALSAASMQYRHAALRADPTAPTEIAELKLAIEEAKKTEQEAFNNAAEKTQVLQDFLTIEWKAEPRKKKCNLNFETNRAACLPSVSETKHFEMELDDIPLLYASDCYQSKKSEQCINIESEVNPDNVNFNFNENMDPKEILKTEKNALQKIIEKQKKYFKKKYEKEMMKAFDVGTELYTKCHANLETLVTFANNFFTLPEIAINPGGRTPFFDATTVPGAGAYGETN